MKKTILTLVLFALTANVFAQNFDDLANEKRNLIRHLIAITGGMQKMQTYINEQIPQKTKKDIVLVSMLEREKDSILFQVVTLMDEYYTYDEIKTLVTVASNPKETMNPALLEKQLEFPKVMRIKYKPYLDRFIQRLLDVFNTEAKQIVLKFSYDTASFKLDSLLELNPIDADIWFAKGYLEFTESEFNKAKVNLSMALALEPNHEESIEVLAKAYYQLGEYNEAVVAINRALGNDSTNVTLLQMRASVGLNLYQFTDCIKYYTKALNYSDYARYELYFERGFAYKIMGDSNRAKRDFFDALHDIKNSKAMDSSDLNLIEYEADIYTALELYKEAADIQLSLIRLDSTQTYLRYKLALTYDNLNLLDLGIKQFDTFLFSRPKHIMALNTRAYMLIKNGEYERAKVDLYKAINMAPKQGYLHSNLGRALTLEGHYKKAEKSLKTSLELDPNNSYAYKYYGQLELLRKNNNRACYYFQEANRLGFTARYGDEVMDLMGEHCK
jgi:tetratricopeptide (TPR) repeat protein